MKGMKGPSGDPRARLACLLLAASGMLAHGCRESAAPALEGTWLIDHEFMERPLRFTAAEPDRYGVTLECKGDNHVGTAIRTQDGVIHIVFEREQWAWRCSLAPDGETGSCRDETAAPGDETPIWRSQP
jgi:hypothetical protein